MDRRSALALLASGVLGGCGGGGGGGAAPMATSTGTGTGGGPAAQEAAPSPGPAPASSPVPAAGPASVSGAAQSRNIAAWGDSMTALYVPSLQQAFPDRQVHNGGVVGETSMQIAARQTADAEHKSWISIFWYGHNNWSKDDVKADIQASVAALAPGNGAFIVMSMVNWANSGERGTQEYDNMMRVNRELAALYPDNYLDIHRHLVGLYDPASGQDVQDFQNDLPPSSLRFDAIHLNAAGCDAVAAKLQEVISVKGW